MQEITANYLLHIRSKQGSPASYELGCRNSYQRHVKNRTFGKLSMTFLLRVNYSANAHFNQVWTDLYIIFCWKEIVLPPCFIPAGRIKCSEFLSVNFLEQKIRIVSPTNVKKYWPFFAQRQQLQNRHRAAIYALNCTAVNQCHCAHFSFFKTSLQKMNKQNNVVFTTWWHRITQFNDVSAICILVLTIGNPNQLGEDREIDAKSYNRIYIACLLKFQGNTHWLDVFARGLATFVWRRKVQAIMQNFAASTLQCTVCCSKTSIEAVSLSLSLFLLRFFLFFIVCAHFGQCIFSFFGVSTQGSDRGREHMPWRPAGPSVDTELAANREELNILRAVIKTTAKVCRPHFRIFQRTQSDLVVAIT